MTSAVSFFDVRDSFQGVKTPKTSTSASTDIGVQISVRSSVRPSTFMSKIGFLDIKDSCESETLHANSP